MSLWPICLCVLCVLCGASAEAAVDDYVGRPIASVRLLLEGREIVDTGLTRVIQTRVGQPLSLSAVRESITHLFNLGRFDDVRVDASAEAGGIALRYELSPVHPVREIAFAGTPGDGVDTGQLRKLVVDRFGTSPPLSRTAELVQTVTVALAERGYLHADVTSRAVIAHEPDRATLVLTIASGPRTLVGDIDFAESPAARRGEVLGRLGLFKGAPYQRIELNARIDRYLAELRRQGYYEAKLDLIPRLADGDRTVHLTVALMAGPHVRVVFAGDPLPPDMRAEFVPIELEGSADEDLLEDSTNRIEEYFRAQGYRDARAPHRRDESDGELRVTFDVKRGVAYRVNTVAISGNASVPLTDFEAALRLREGRAFSETTLDADVAMIEDLYRRRGFVGARVQAGTEPGPVQAADAFVPLAVRIVISEGPRTIVTAVRVEGNLSVSTEMLLQGLGLQPGRPYFETQLVLDRDAIQLQYVNLGFVTATVDADPNLSVDRTRVEPLFIVREGPRIFVEHVLIVGNLRTSLETVERELQLKTGDPLSASAKIESQRRLMALGLFRRVQISDLRSGDETHRDLLVSLEESPVTTVAFGGGVEGRLRVVRSEENPGVASERLEFAPRGSFEVGRRNFFGKNRSANLFTSVSLHPKDSPFFAANPTAGDSSGFGFAEYRVIGQFREPRVFGSADAFFTGTIEQQIRSSFNFARRSATAEVARGITRRLSAIGSYQIQRTRVFDESIRPEDKLLIDRLFPQVRLSLVSLTLIHDTRNDLIDPGSGHYVSGSMQLAGRRIGSEVGFAKTYTRAQAFRTVNSAHGIVLAGNAQLGLANGFPREVSVFDAHGNLLGVTEVEDLPASERFFAGGDTTVRGYALDTVGTPDTLDQDGFPIGGNAMVVFKGEVRVPVRSGIGVVGFFDTGNVFARVVDIDLTELRSAAGLGLRYKSPVGPIRVDVGFKIHPQGRERLTAWHVSFGQAF